MTVAHLQRIAADAMGLVPARRALTDQFLSRMGWLGGDENFLTIPASRSLTDVFYAGHLSAENSQEIKRLRLKTGTPWRSIAEGSFTDIAS